jgi:hypothetical protein
MRAADGRGDAGSQERNVEAEAAWTAESKATAEPDLITRVERSIQTPTTGDCDCSPRPGSTTNIPGDCPPVGAMSMHACQMPLLVALAGAEQAASADTHAVPSATPTSRSIPTRVPPAFRVSVGAMSSMPDAVGWNRSRAGSLTYTHAVPSAPTSRSTRDATVMSSGDGATQWRNCRQREEGSHARCRGASPHARSR